MQSINNCYRICETCEQKLPIFIYFDKYHKICKFCEGNGKNLGLYTIKEYLENYKLIQHKRKKKELKIRLKSNLRSRLYCAIKNNQKVGSAVRDLGCSIDFLKTYLELKFQEGMSWENYGCLNTNWSIDHIKPLDSFNLSNRKQFLKANHYTNLQPLWVKDNSIKGNNLHYE